MRVILFGVVGGGESLCKHSVGVWEDWENVGGLGDEGHTLRIHVGRGQWILYILISKCKG